jgi:hypothetical protein
MLPFLILHPLAFILSVVRLFFANAITKRVEGQRKFRIPNSAFLFFPTRYSRLPTALLSQYPGGIRRERRLVIMRARCTPQPQEWTQKQTLWEQARDIRADKTVVSRNN